MGRVSRYKKNKNCDPFNVAPTKLLHRDRAPSKEELEKDVQAVPRSFRHMMSFTKSIEHKKSVATRRREEAAKRKTTETRKESGTPGESSTGSTKKKKKKQASEGQVEAKPKPGTSFTRLPGESDKAFLQRIDSEGAQRLVKIQQELKPMRDRRKEYLSRKKRKKGKEVEAPLDFVKSDNVRFGDVVLQPPSLSAKPRKAPDSSASKLVSSLKLSGQGSSSSDPPATDASAAGDEVPVSARPKAQGPAAPKSVKSKDLTPVQRQRHEAARLTAIEQYREQKRQQQQAREA